MSRFVIRAEHYLKPGARAAWLALAHANSRESLKEPGVQRFDVLVSRADPDHALLYEIYDSREAWLLHCKTSHFNAFVEGIRELIHKRERGEFDLLTGE